MFYDARAAAKKKFEVQGCIAFWQALIKYGPENISDDDYTSDEEVSIDYDLEYYENSDFTSSEPDEN